MKNYTETKKHFEKFILPSVIDHYGDGDNVAINEEWTYYIDGLCKDGEIGLEEYSSWEYQPDKPSRTRLDTLAKGYLMEAISDPEDCGYPETDLNPVLWVYETFKSEYGWAIERKGEQSAMAEWFSGLPSVINIEYRNYEILNLAYQWGSLDWNANDTKCQKILDNWFNFCAAKFLQMVRKESK